MVDSEAHCRGSAVSLSVVRKRICARLLAPCFVWQQSQVGVGLIIIRLISHSVRMAAIMFTATQRSLGSTNSMVTAGRDM